MRKIWIPIKGFEGIYEFSLPGHVRNVRTRYCLKQYIGKIGYVVFNLWGHNKNTPIYLHRLIAENYLPNPYKKPQVNHKDGNKLNNNLLNLDWVTKSENHKHAHLTGLCQSPTPRKLSEQNVRDIKIALKNPYKGLLKELGKKFNVTPEAIGLIKNNKNWKHINIETTPTNHK